ncbi:MAG: kelch repeat-containing protein [Pseudomonadota bacterium]
MRLLLGVLTWTLLIGASTARAGPVEDLLPGEWYQVPDSHMRAVDPCPNRTCDYSAVGGQAAVMGAWGGGAFDTARDRLLVWGGGHGDYAGNELYAFDLTSLRWSRLTEPSSPPGEDVPYAPDGNPTSRHTYNYVQYVPIIDAFCSFGGAAFYISGQTGTQHTDCFNFATGLWEQRADVTARGSIIGAFSAVDPSTGHAWLHGCGGMASLAEYDASADSWTSHGGQWTESEYFSYSLTAAIDPVGQQLVAVGGGAAYRWDLTVSGDSAAVVLSTSGEQTVVQASTPGFVYDPVSAIFVGWAGGAEVLTLDPTTWAWTRVAAAATNTVVPTAPASNGTFGRFRYAPTHNVFVVVNAVDEDVFVYRLSDGTGQSPPIVTLAANPSSVARGGSSELSWSSQHATGCTAAGAWSGSRPTSGSETVGPLDATSSFQLSCTGSAGTGGASITVEVPALDAGSALDVARPEASVDAGVVDARSPQDAGDGDTRMTLDAGSATDGAAADRGVGRPEGCACRGAATGSGLGWGLLLGLGALGRWRRWAGSSPCP